MNRGDVTVEWTSFLGAELSCLAVSSFRVYKIYVCEFIIQLALDRVMPIVHLLLASASGVWSFPCSWSQKSQEAHQVLPSSNRSDLSLSPLVSTSLTGTW